MKTNQMWRIMLCTIGLVTAMLVASSQVYGQSCCEEHLSPGCDDPECEALVCDDDPFCCDVEWDLPCADDAIELCGECEEGCGAADAGDCCKPNGTPNCENAECCETVCGFDPFCCETEWDWVCAIEAHLVPACDCWCK